MTVQELLDELNKVENKEKVVIFEVDDILTYAHGYQFLAECVNEDDDSIKIS
ncbi:hypothetical protein [Exiguobacterium sp. s140]|uniref:hypothetical protein n=1 Tax=Exiguobacterium sp. s140 TaxID=2751290 RepID=UPI001BECB03E|nr:hypothetical protein [Exiguobacterium sp. s140]